MWDAAGAHADESGGLIHVFQEGLLDDARSVVELFQQRALGGNTTTALVDLDALPRAGQTILLKTAEEMPAWGYLILTSTGYVLPTLRSRCQTVTVEPVEVAEPAFVRAKPAVMSYLDAVARHDREAIALVTSNWDDDAEDMLWRWCTEVLADWPRLFTKAELAVVHKLGVTQFYAMVDHLRAKLSPSLIAMMLWKMR